jgi:hypothetical protein
MLLPSFDSFGEAVSVEKIKKNQPTRNKNLPVASMIVNSVYSLDFIINKYFSNFHKSIQVFVVVYFKFLYK